MADQRKPTNPFMGDLAQFAAPEFAGAREAARGIAVGAGGANTDKNIATVMGQFNQVGGGSMGPQGMEMLMRATQNLAQRNGITYNEVLQMGQAGAQIGGQLGFNPNIGMATATQAAGFGQAFQQQGGRGITAAHARQLDQELRMSAANSPMANMLGAAMAMSESGLFKAGQTVNLGGQQVNLGALSGNDPTKRQETLSQLARLNPAQFVDTMRQAGVNPETAAQFLGAQGANKDQIARHGIQNVVRGMQREEVRGMMSEEMSGAFQGALRQAGVRDPRQRRGMAMAAGDAITQAMEAMAADPNAKNLSPAERNKRLSTAANKALAGSGLSQEQIGQLTAGAVRSMEERVASDPDLRRFGNVEGLLNMNRSDIVQRGMGNAAQAEEDARRDLGKAGPKQEAPAPGGGGGAPGGGAGEKAPDKLPPPPNVEDMKKRQQRINELRTKMNIPLGGQGAQQMSDLVEASKKPEAGGKLTEEQKELAKIYQQQGEDNRRLNAATGQTVNAQGQVMGVARQQPGGQGAPQPGAGGAATPQAIKITGNLTVRVDGSAQLDDATGVPVNE